MKKALFSSLALFLVLTSCKDNKENTEAAPKEAAVVTVTIRAAFEKDDSFAVYFDEEGKEAFKPENAVIVEAKGKAGAQDLVFKMPEDVRPLSLRFDLGANPEQGKVTIETFTITKGDKTFTAPGKDFTKYLAPNDQIGFDVASGTATITKPEGAVLYDPFFLPTQALRDEMVKLYKEEE